MKINTADRKITNADVRRELRRLKEFLISPSEEEIKYAKSLKTLSRLQQWRTVMQVKYLR